MQDNLQDLGAVPAPQASQGDNLSDLGAVPVPQSQSQSGGLLNYEKQNMQDIGNQFGTIGNAILGAGDAARNTIASGLNILPGVNIPMAQSAQGPGYGVGKFAGNVGSFLAAGEALDAARAASEALPYVGQAAQYLGGTGMAGVARRALGSGLYGALATPTNRAQQAGIGAGMSAALDAVPGVGSALASGANYLMPQKFAQRIIQNLGGGQTLEGATKSVLSDIKNAGQNQKQIAGGMFNNVRSQIPDQNGSIYSTPGGVGSYQPEGLGNVYQDYSTASSPSSSPIGAGLSPANDSFGGNPTSQTGNTAINPEIPAANTPFPSSWTAPTTPQSTFSNLRGQYPSLGTDITSNYTTPIKNMHNQFIQNPTFQNAHALQSQIGTRIRELNDVPSDMATANEKYALQTARSALVGRDAQGNITGDIGTYLNNISPNLADQYKNAADYFYQNYTPYLNTPKISDIVSGNITNMQPSSLGNLFKAPGDSMNTILSQLPSSTFDNLLYTKLGQTVPSKSAQGLVNKYQDLDQQGLGSYISPGLQSDIGALNNRIKYRNALQAGVGTVAGAVGGSHLGPLGTVLGASFGGALGFGASAIANPFINYIGKRLPNTDLSEAAQSGLRGTYSGLRQAILANQLNNSSNGGQ